MGGLLLLVFLVLPILEIVVFIQAGKWIGLWPTVACILMSALIGGTLVRHQGFAVLKNAQESVGEGRFPAAQAFDGLCLVLAGALLLTPGFITDAAGFLLLVPWFRTLLRRIVGNRMLASGRVEVWADPPLSRRPSPPRPSSPGGSRGGVIIDADYEHVPEEPPDERQAPDERQPPGERPQTEKDPRAASPWRKGEVRGEAPETDGRWR